MSNVFRNINRFLSKHTLLTLIIGAVIGYCIGLVLPSKAVIVKNIPKKELTCTLNSEYDVVYKKTSDPKLKILYNNYKPTSYDKYYN